MDYFQQASLLLTIAHFALGGFACIGIVRRDDIEGKSYTPGFENPNIPH